MFQYRQKFKDLTFEEKCVVSGSKNNAEEDPDVHSMMGLIRAKDSAKRRSRKKALKAILAMRKS